MSSARRQTSKTNRDTPKPISGHATSAGTKGFSERFEALESAGFYRPLTDDTLVSSIGMGTYLGDCTNDEDERYVQVLCAGVERGLNFIDTAINYRCQRSERAVGAALAQLTENNVAERDELVIATKGGYVPLDGAPPSSRELYDSFLAKEYFEREIMQPADVVSGGHCIAPTFLSDQIERSLANLGISTIDLYYIHNPEHQRSVSDGREFRKRISAAFHELESQVSRGTIRHYGVATWNGLRQPSNAATHLSLEEMVAAAREAGGDSNHFRVVQLPVNLAMLEAVREPTQTLNGRAVSLLHAAAELGVSVVASASLMQSQLTSGLPDAVASAFPSLHTDAQRAIAFTRSLPLCTALVGMRSLDHLSENLGAASYVTAS